MVLATLDNDYKRRAFDNLSRSLDPDLHLPERVFSTDWRCFRFFPSDRLFDADFIGVVHALLAVERGMTSCLLNLSETRSFSHRHVAALFLDVTVAGTQFVDQLRGDGPASGWLYAMDRYACISDVGRWCIYCEKENDIAVIALRGEMELNDFRQPLQELGSLSLNAINEDVSCPFPFNSLLPAWRASLGRTFFLPSDIRSGCFIAHSAISGD
jgi:hypothetical protein